MRLSAGSFPACFVVAEDWVPLSISWDVSFTEGFGSKSFQRKGRNNIMKSAGEHRCLMHWNGDLVYLSITCIVAGRALHKRCCFSERQPVEHPLLRALRAWMPEQSLLDTRWIQSKQVSVCGFFMLTLSSSGFLLMDDLVLIREPGLL